MPAPKAKVTLPKEVIDSVLETLEKVGCQFWSCPGPEKRTVHMRTCFVCMEIKDLKRAVKKAEKVVLKKIEKE